MLTHEQLREEWIAKGRPWFHVDDPAYLAGRESAERDVAAVREQAQALMVKLETYRFESRGGPLTLCEDWIRLKAIIQGSIGSPQ